MVEVFWHFCLFLTDCIAVVDLIGPRAIAHGEGTGSRARHLDPSLHELDLSKDATISGRIG